MTLRRALFSLLSLALWTGCTPPRPNLLLVVVDTLRADHLGSYGYARDTSPHLDALAAAGVRFERVYASAPWTMPSVASILTGQHPSRHGLVHRTRPLPRAATSLAERLSEAGYRTAAVTSHILLEPRYGFDQGFDVFHARAGGHDAPTGANVTRAAASLIAELAMDGGDPFFIFVHYFDPHYAYLDHRQYAYAVGSAGRVRSAMSYPELLEMRDVLTREEIDFVRALYDEEIRYTDTQLALLLEELAVAGAYDDTWVVVTADHGEEFLEHGWLGHTTSLYDTQLRVPLVMKPPGPASGPVVVEPPVSLVSLAPTLLDLLGLPVTEADFDGVSLAPLVRGERAEAGPVFSEVDYRQHPQMRASQRMLVVYPHKLIEDRLAGRTQLFDLASDAAEKVDLSATHPDLVASLRAELEAVAPPRPARSAAPPALTDDEHRQLRELGYAE